MTFWHYNNELYILSNPLRLAFIVIDTLSVELVLLGMQFNLIRVIMLLPLVVDDDDCARRMMTFFTDHSMSLKV